MPPCKRPVHERGQRRAKGELVVDKGTNRGGVALAAQEWWKKPSARRRMKGPSERGGARRHMKAAFPEMMPRLRRHVAVQWTRLSIMSENTEKTMTSELSFTGITSLSLSLPLDKELIGVVADGVGDGGRDTMSLKRRSQRPARLPVLRSLGRSTRRA